MSRQRTLASVIVILWVAVCITLSYWAMNHTFSLFHQEALRKGLASYEAFFYALKLSGAAATWIKIPLIFANVPVAMLVANLWKKGKPQA
jgi:hypothetical protein